MTELEFTSVITVKLVRCMAGDDMVVQAAQVSSKGENNPDTIPERLINALMRGKHGSPFEHNAFTFFVEAPLFVFREWQRHRISSFNEMSGRYTELLPKFYILGEDRPVINVGTDMKPKFAYEDTVVRTTNIRIRENAAHAWTWYEQMLREGVAKEVARMVLPLNIYSQMYWTVNARSLMNFLSLRSSQEGATFPSYPQREIQMAAEGVELAFAREMPITYQTFIKNGRVAP